MRPCEICGSPIQTHLGEYACKNCGADYVNEDGFDPKKNMISPPPWGEIKIDLSSLGSSWNNAFNKLKDDWHSLESVSHLSIFREQFEDIQPPRQAFTLYAPKPVFVALEKTLETFNAGREAIEFSLLPREELYRIRDRFRKNRD